MNWKKELVVNDEHYTYFDLSSIVDTYKKNITDYPYSIRVLLESLARHQEHADLENLIAFDAKNLQALFLSALHGLSYKTLLAFQQSWIWQRCEMRSLS